MQWAIPGSTIPDPARRRPLCTLAAGANYRGSVLRRRLSVGGAERAWNGRLADVKAHDGVGVFEGALAECVVIFVVVVKRFPQEILLSLAFRCHVAVDGILTRQCKWCSPSTFAGKPPPYFSDTWT